VKAVSPLIVSILLAACGKPDPVDDKAKNTAGLPAGDQRAPDATGAPPASAAPVSSATTAAAAAAPTPPAIPAALHGRWGMAPDDCTSTRGDAKGLLLITPTEIRFYESRAVPGANTNVSADSIRGDFTFTGEGQTWTKFEALQLNRQELVRTESNPTASFTYAKCK
jgi:hypothetical protein